MVNITLRKGQDIVYQDKAYTSKTDGFAVFSIDIEDLPSMGSSTELTGEYGFQEGTARSEFKITFKWIVPNISIYSGQDQLGEFGKKLKEQLTIKIVDNDGNPVNKWPVQWSVKTGNGFIISDSETNAGGLARATWTFGSNLDRQSIEVTAKDRAGENANGSPRVFNATVVDSLELYKKAVVGKWSVTHYDPSNPSSTYEFELFAGGSGRYSFVNTDEGNIVYYPTTWTVSKNTNGGYVLYEVGFFHPAYNYLRRDRLTYPLTSFKTYANFDDSFVSQVFTKK